MYVHRSTFLLVSLILAISCRHSGDIESTTKDSNLEPEEKSGNICTQINLKAADLLLSTDTDSGSNIFNRLKSEHSSQITDEILQLRDKIEFLENDSMLVFSEDSFCSYIQKGRSTKAMGLTQPSLLSQARDLCYSREKVSQCYYSKSNSKACYYLRKKLKDKAPVWVNDSCEVVYSGIRTTLNGSAGQFCNFLNYEAIGESESPACGAQVISTVCGLHVKFAGEVEKHLARFQKAPIDKQQSVEKITKTFISAALKCGASLGVAQLKEAIVHSPDSGLADVGRFIFSESTLENLSNEAAKVAEDGSYAYCPTCLSRFNIKGAAKGVAKGLGLAACSVAADRIATAIDENAPLPSYSSCSDKGKTSSRAAACFRTVKSACRSYAGLVDFNQIVEAKGAGGIAVDSLSIAASLGCRAGGKTTSVACGVISESMNQIKMAIKEGNNSWAECAGTTKLGACIGEWIAAGGYTNNSAISMPVKDKTGATVRDCCHCQKTTYKARWFRDKVINKDLYTSVIQSGDFKSGSCNRPGGKRQGSKFWRKVSSVSQPGGKPQWVYHKYSDCKKVRVKGDSCHKL